MKLAGGSRVSEIDPDAFLAQAAEYDASGDLRDGVLKLLNIELLSHPFSVLRAAELKRWVDDGEYAQILRGEYPHRSADDDARIGDEFRNAARTYKQNFDQSDDPLIRVLRDVGSGLGDAVGAVGHGCRRGRRGHQGALLPLAQALGRLTRARPPACVTPRRRRRDHQVPIHQHLGGERARRAGTNSRRRRTSWSPPGWRPPGRAWEKSPDRTPSRTISSSIRCCSSRMPTKASRAPGSMLRISGGRDERLLAPEHVEPQQRFDDGVELLTRRRPRFRERLPAAAEQVDHAPLRQRYQQRMLRRIVVVETGHRQSCTRGDLADRCTFVAPLREQVEGRASGPGNADVVVVPPRAGYLVGCHSPP